MIATLGARTSRSRALETSPALVMGLRDARLLAKRLTEILLRSFAVDRTNARAKRSSIFARSRNMSRSALVAIALVPERCGERAGAISSDHDYPVNTTVDCAQLVSQECCSRGLRREERIFSWGVQGLAWQGREHGLAFDGVEC